MPSPSASPISLWRAPWQWLAAFPSRFQRRTSSGTYRPEIDGLRFFAIALVVVGHLMERAVRFFPSYQAMLESNPVAQYLQFSPGLGVELFFTISGFIIATQARKAGKSPLNGSFLKAYFGRRILRIEPPYMIVLLATWAFVGLTGFVPDKTHQFFTAPDSLNLSLLGSVFYVHDLVWGTYPRLFPLGWSLEVEVQFYILAPLLLWLWLRCDDVASRALLAAIGLFLGSYLSVLGLQQIGGLHVYNSILRAFHFFWLGIVLAQCQGLIRAKAAALPPALATAMGWLSLVGYLALPYESEDISLAFAIRFATLLAFTAMFASAFAPQSGFRRFCAWPWISLLGGACYSLYIVHMQPIHLMSSLAGKFAPGLPLAGVFAFMAAQVVIVAAMGLTFYVAVERVFMRPEWHLAALGGLRRVVGRQAAKHVAAAPSR